MNFQVRLSLGSIVSDQLVSGNLHPHLDGIAHNAVTPEFRMTDELLKTHLAVFGGTRRGKSKLFELLMRQLIEAGRGLAFVDPHSDTADDLFAFLAYHQDEFGYLCNRVHYLRPDDRTFCFDPFAYHGPEPELDGRAAETYRRWLHGKILDVIAILLRNRNETEAEQAKMTRMRTWLYNGLFAVGVRQADGRHLALSELFVLLNPKHRRHEETYRRVEPFLTEQVRADFDILRSLRSPNQIQDFVESTFNQLRQVITPTTERVFATDRPTIDFHRIVQRSEILLASLGRTTLFHQQESTVLAGLIVREISEAVRTVARDERRRFFLFLDEAQNFLGEDLQDLLKESGKYKLSCALAMQSLDNLQSQEIDLVPAVLGQCNMQVTFQQQHYPDAELLARCLCYPWLDYSELMQEADRDDGYEWTMVRSSSRGTSRGKSTQRGTSTSQTKATTRSESNGTGTSQSEANSINWSRSRGFSDTTGSSSSVTLSQSKSKTHSSSDSDGGSNSTSDAQNWSSGTSDAYGQSFTESAQETDRYTNEWFFRWKRAGRSQSASLGRSHTQTNSSNSGGSHSETEGNTWGHTEGHSTGNTTGRADSTGTTKQHSDSRSVSEGGGTSHTNGTSTSQSWSRGSSEGETDGQSTTKGESHSESQSTSQTLTPLRKTRVEVQHTGSLQTSLNDQDRMHTSVIQSLPVQHCLVAVGNRSFVLKVAHVSDPYESIGMADDLRLACIDALKSDVFSREPYFFDALSDSIEEANQSDHTPPAEPPPSFDLG